MLRPLRSLPNSRQLISRTLCALALMTAICTSSPGLCAQAQPGDLADSLRIADMAGGLEAPLANFSGFGAAVVPIGDLDGNGVAELAVGAPKDDDEGENRGAVWILFRDSSGQVMQHQKISSSAGNFEGRLDDLDHFGHALANIGDLDGDGLPELAVGAPGDDDGGSIIFPDPSVGAVWILYLRRDGRVRAQRKISALSGQFAGPLNELDRFGSSVTQMGDFNGDGVPDIAVGAPGDNNFGINAGAFWLLTLNPDGSVTSQVKNPLGTSSSGTGAALALIGDLNGDGVPDVATAGEKPDPQTGEPEGYAIVAFLAADGTVQADVQLQTPPGATDDFGSSIAAIPDLDGDGFQELVIGAHKHDGGGMDRGSVWIAFMLPAGFVKSYARIGSDTSLFNPSLSDGDALGIAVAGVGDDDGDGIPDLFVGAVGDDGLGQDRGAVWRLSLSDGTWTALVPGIPGTDGTPSLHGRGSLKPATPINLSLHQASPASATWLVAGSKLLGQPFLGGVLAPGPGVIKGPFMTEHDGTLELGGLWPLGIAPGTTLYYQAWVADAVAPEGFAASNGLSSTAP